MCTVAQLVFCAPTLLSVLHEEIPVQSAHRLVAIHPEAATDLLITADGKRLVSSGADGLIAVTSLPSFESQNEFRVGKEVIFSIDLSASETLLLAAASDDHLHTWDWKQQTLARKQSVGNPGLVMSAWSPTQSDRWAYLLREKLEGGSQGNFASRLVLMDSGQSEPVWEKQFPGYQATMTWSPSGDRIVVGLGNGTIHSIGLDGEGGALSIDKLGSLIYLVEHGPADLDGQLLAVVTWEGEFVLLQLDPDSEADVSKQHRLPNGSAGISALCFSPDGQWLAVATHLGFIRLLRVADRKVVRNLKGHLNAVQAMAFSANGQWLFTAGGDGTIGAFGMSEATRMLSSTKPESHRTPIRGTDLLFDRPAGLLSGVDDRSWREDGVDMWSNNRAEISLTSIIYEQRPTDLKRLLRKESREGEVTELHVSRELTIAECDSLFLEFAQACADHAYGDKEELLRKRVWLIHLGGDRYLYWRLETSEARWPWVKDRLDDMMPFKEH